MGRRARWHERQLCAARPLRAGGKSGHQEYGFGRRLHSGLRDQSHRSPRLRRQSFGQFHGAALREGDVVVCSPPARSATATPPSCAPAANRFSSNTGKKTAISWCSRAPIRSTSPSNFPAPRSSAPGPSSRPSWSAKCGGHSGSGWENLKPETQRRRGKTIGKRDRSRHPIVPPTSASPNHHPPLVPSAASAHSSNISALVPVVRIFSFFPLRPLRLLSFSFWR